MNEYDVLLYSKWIEIAHNDLGQEDKMNHVKGKELIKQVIANALNDTERMKCPTALDEL
jgi:hypothetical protein